MKNKKPRAGKQKKGNWKEGPLPAGTYNWGGVVTKECLGEDGTPSGFLFADFCGDYVMVQDVREGHFVQRRIEAADVVLYDNSLVLPPGSKYA